MPNQIITLAPSGFGFLYEECQTCYYYESLGIRKRPRTPFPAIFSTIDLAMKRHFSSADWHGGDDWRFRIVSQGRWVKSCAIEFPEVPVSLAIRGSYDSLIAFESAEHAVCDFKTSAIRPNLVPKYARQLHAYALALEQPAVGAPIRIDRLGLGVFEPNCFSSEADQRAILGGKLGWLEIPKEHESFRSFLREVAILLSGDPPPPNEACGFCAYREAA